MIKPTKTQPRDPNQLAARILRLATGEEQLPSEEPASPTTEARRKGGKAGGPARAEKLTSEERSAIAKKAAKARWTDDKQ